MLNRRNIILGAAAVFAAGPVFALSKSGATSLINGMVGAINGVIAANKSQSASIREFEKIFQKYADVPIIARFTLGPDARSASASDMSVYTKSFRGYIARKYGKRFNEFKGGKVTVNSTRKAGKNYDVNCTATLPGKSAFNITFRVSDRSGTDKMFDLLIEGVSLLKSEAVEVRALLDRNNGNIRALSKALDKRG